MNSLEDLSDKMTSSTTSSMAGIVPETVTTSYSAIQEGTGISAILTNIVSAIPDNTVNNNVSPIPENTVESTGVAGTNEIAEIMAMGIVSDL
jgi:hypothetical protein